MARRCTCTPRIGDHIRGRKPTRVNARASPARERGGAKSRTGAQAGAPKGGASCHTHQPCWPAVPAQRLLPYAMRRCHAGFADRDTSWRHCASPHHHSPLPPYVGATHPAAGGLHRPHAPGLRPCRSREQHGAPKCFYFLLVFSALPLFLIKHASIFFENRDTCLIDAVRMAYWHELHLGMWMASTKNG